MRTTVRAGRLLGLAAALLAAPSFAQEGGAEAPEPPAERAGVEQITVTAQKREENVQDVPISVTALSGSLLEDAGIQEFARIQEFTPNLGITRATGSRSSIIRIRGIGSVGSNAGVDPSVGVFVDGVYQSRAGMSVTDLLDVERVEILRGPQGTLYGKNTAAGAINVISRRPAYELESLLEGVVGNFDAFEGRGSVNVPIVENRMATRISGYRVARDGLDRNLFDGDRVNDQDKWGLKARTLVALAEDLELLVTTDYSDEDTTCCVPDILSYEGANPLAGDFEAVAALAGKPLTDTSPFDRVVNVDARTRNRVKIWGIAGELNWFLGDHVLTGIVAYRRYESEDLFDGDFSNLDAVTAGTETALNQTSYELRLASPSGGLFEYVAGLYHYHQNQDTEGFTTVEEDFTASFNVEVAPLLDPVEGNTDVNHHETDTLAAFGQLSVTPVHWVSLTGGLRISREGKQRVGSQRSTLTGIDTGIFGPDRNLDESRWKTDWSATASVRVFLREDLMLYASVNRGFKSGGFNQIRVPVSAPTEFDDETSHNFEGGIRSAWLERLLTLNLTGFYTFYDDFQAFSFDGQNFFLTNAGDLRSWGFEMEAVALPLEGLMLRVAVGFNRARYRDFDRAQCTAAQAAAEIARTGNPLAPCVQNLDGEVLDNAPEWTLSGIAHYERPLPWWDLTAFVRAEYSYTDDLYLAQDLDPALARDGYHLANFRGGLRGRDDWWELTLWTENAFDEDFLVAGFDIPLLSGYAGVNGSRRTWGGTLRLRF